jgi:hypothetical protein
MQETESGKDSMSERTDDLWLRIKELAEREGISYLDATERCVKEYWEEKGLSKEV